MIKVKDTLKDNYELRAHDMVMLRPLPHNPKKKFVRYSLNREALRTSLNVVFGTLRVHFFYTPWSGIPQGSPHGFFVVKARTSTNGKALHIGCKKFGSLTSTKIIKWAQGGRTYGKTKRSK